MRILSKAKTATTGSLAIPDRLLVEDGLQQAFYHAENQDKPLQGHQGAKACYRPAKHVYVL